MGILPFWWYRSTRWRKHGSGGFYLVLGVEVHEHTPRFFLGIGSSQKTFANTFESKFKKMFQKLRKHGWEKDSEPGWDWCYAKFFPLGDGAIDKIADKQAKNVMSATQALQRFGIIKSMQKQIEHPTR